MLRWIAVCIVSVGAFFFGSLLTMGLSDLIVRPFGLHGYSYPQAMAVDAMLTLIVFISIVVTEIIGAILD